MGSGNYQVTDIADNLGTHHAQDAFEKKGQAFHYLPFLHRLDRF